MAIRNIDERITTVSSICNISRNNAQLLLENHGWNCDYAISGYFDGELNSIVNSKKKFIEKKKEEPIIEIKELTDDDPLWPKELQSFQVIGLSTVSSAFGLTVGTQLRLEPECKVRISRRKAQILTKSNNEELPARCRVYQQVGSDDSQRSYIGRIDNKIGNDLAILLELIVEVSVHKHIFMDMYKYLQLYPLSKTSILKKAFPTGSTSFFADSLNVLYYSIYTTQGQQKQHSKLYTDSITKTITTSFPQLEITTIDNSSDSDVNEDTNSNTSQQMESTQSTELVTHQNTSKVEVLQSENSTGIISSIRNRLKQQAERIEVTDTLSDNDTLQEEEEEIELVSNEDFNSKLPIAECSQGLRNIQLREYQLQALFWMLQREQGKHVESSSLLQPMNKDDETMWETHYFSDHTCFYFCPLFRLVTLENPSHLYKMRGGIIADEMGLGKTITMLSLLLINRGKENEKISIINKNEENEIKTNETDPAMLLMTPVKYCGGTLIICPLSLLYMWQSEIINHLEPQALTCCIYHNNAFYEVCIGHKPLKLVSALNYDVVITTYDSCTSAFINTKEKNWLYETQWKRIIIDEGHIIKNDKTIVHKAVVSLKGTIHWVMSGTPLQNTVNDLFALFRFLRYEPWCYRNVWDNIINNNKKAETKESEVHGDIHINMSIDTKTNLNRLRYPLSLIMLRRTYQSRDSHNQLIVALPHKQVIIQKIQFTSSETSFYSQLLQRTRTMFNDFVLQGIIKSRYAMILSLLLSLRQACDHPFLLLNRAKGLLKRKEEDELEKSITTDFINKIYDSAYNGTKHVESYMNEIMKEVKTSGGLGHLICPICCEPIKLHPVFTKCLHYFCEDCIEHLAKETGFPIRCPNCRQLNSRQDLITTNYHNFEYKTISFNPQTMWHSSSKIDFILTELDRIWRCYDDNEIEAKQQYGNILIFSQWTSMLDYIGLALKKNGMDYLKFDGSMSKQEREAVLSQFEYNYVPDDFSEEVNKEDMLEEIDEVDDVDEHEEREDEHHQQHNKVNKVNKTKKQNPLHYFKSHKRQQPSADKANNTSNTNKADNTDNTSNTNIADKANNTNNTNNTNKKLKLNQPSTHKSKYPQILLISLRAGGVGLNLTSANVVFMCDPWWNEAVENQAINRAFRIGQKRKVFVYRLIVENTIEEKILKLQEKKEQLIQSTLDFQNATTIKLTVDEIAELLQ